MDLSCSKSKSVLNCSCVASAVFLTRRILEWLLLLLNIQMQNAMLHKFISFQLIIRSGENVDFPKKQRTTRSSSKSPSSYSLPPVVECFEPNESAMLRGRQRSKRQFQTRRDNFLLAQIDSE